MNAASRIEDLSAQEILKKLKDRSIVLVDVREADEHHGERIEGALLHPLSTFDPAALPKPQDREVVFHCGSGKRSAMAVAKCLERGLPYKAHMAGGIQAWKSAGLPTVVGKPKS